MHLEPLEATFGATVTEIELVALDPMTWEELRAAWLEHALLIFPGQFLDRDAQNDFARRFGRLEFEAVPISNLGRDGQIRARGRCSQLRSSRPVEAEVLLDDLNDWSCQLPRVHFHHWSVGDVVVWDNRRLMHRATPQIDRGGRLHRLVECFDRRSHASKSIEHTYWVSLWVQ